MNEREKSKEKAKAKLLLIALLAILLTILTQPPRKYYSTVGTATNVVTLGGVSLKIHEKTADGSDFPAQGVYVIPGDIVSKEVSVENVCGYPFYLRVKLIKGIDGAALSYEDCMKLNLNTTDWTLQNGYYYYNKPLDPGQITEPIFTEVEIVGSKVDNSYIGSTLQLTVSAYAVQSDNNPAEHPWDASGWPADR